MSLVLDDFIATSRQVKSIDQLTTLFGQYLGQHGFTHWAYQVTPPAHEETAKPRIISSYPPAWVDRYITQSYHRIDPIITEGTKRVAPFTWDAVAAPYLTAPPVRTFFAEAADAHLANGFGLSVHGGNHASSIISASSQLPDRDLHHIVNTQGRTLHLVSLVFHNVAKDLLAMESKANPPPHLSKRETECLLWSIAGKSAFDIATILNISENTVRDYFASIRLKFDVTTIREAAIKAYMTGLIRP